MLVIIKLYLILDQDGFADYIATNPNPYHKPYNNLNNPNQYPNPYSNVNPNLYPNL